MYTAMRGLFSCRPWSIALGNSAQDLAWIPPTSPGRERGAYCKLLIINGRALSLQRLHSLPQLCEDEALLLLSLLFLVGPQQVHILLQSLCCLAQLLQLLYVLRPSSCQTAALQDKLHVCRQADPMLRLWTAIDTPLDIRTQALALYFGASVS